MESHEKFPGFQQEDRITIDLPEALVRYLLLHVKDLGELKVILYIFMRLKQSEEKFNFWSYDELSRDPFLVRMLSTLEGNPDTLLINSLRNAVLHEILLEGIIQRDQTITKLYFLNSSRGRAAIQAINKGQWKVNYHKKIEIDVENVLPNIYQVFEENISPITPLIADAIRDAEENFPTSWIYEAIDIAVKRNKRNWNYIHAILKRWQSEGKDGQKDRRNNKKDSQRYTDGEYSDFIEH
jgi:DnaD/phage-associated family protein